MATSLDGFGYSYTNAGVAPPATSATFKLKGGTYGISATMLGTLSSPTLGLQRLALDGVTWVPVHSAFTTAENYLAVTIPAGTYRIAQTNLAIGNTLYFEVAGITGSP
jgi:hypothetical protein